MPLTELLKRVDNEPRKLIRDMTVGEVGWCVAWAFVTFPDPEGMMVRTIFPYYADLMGTCDVLIQRVEGGVIVLDCGSPLTLVGKDYMKEQGWSFIPVLNTPPSPQAVDRLMSMYPSKSKSGLKKWVEGWLCRVIR